MSERIRCPYCDRSIDIENLEMSDLFRELVNVAARLGSAWHLVNEYVSCFAQSFEGRISLKKRLRLIKEVMRLWENCVYELDGKRFRTDQHKIREALTAVCNMDKTGFKNHNYLKRVLTDTAERVSAEGMTAAEERRREEERRAAAKARQEGFFGDGEDVKPVSAEEFKRRKGVSSLLDSIGRPPDEMNSATKNTEES